MHFSTTPFLLYKLQRSSWSPQSAPRTVMISPKGKAWLMCWGQQYSKLRLFRRPCDDLQWVVMWIAWSQCQRFQGAFSILLQQDCSALGNLLCRTNATLQHLQGKWAKLGGFYSLLERLPCFWGSLACQQSTQFWVLALASCSMLGFHYQTLGSVLDC